MDGLRLECKNTTKEDRNSKRNKYGLRHDECAADNEEDEDPAQLAVYKKYAAEITRENYYMFIDFLKHKKVDFIVAPYEADSQLAYMYHAGDINYILTEDSDLVAYGCFRIIRCLKKNGDCKILNVGRKIGKNASPSLKYFLDLDDDKRVQCCILAGCDYLSNIKGMGFGTIIKMCKSSPNFIEKIREIALRKKIKTRAEINAYFNDFEKAYWAFTEQLVYCTAKERLVNLSHRRKTQENQPLKPLDEKYIGKVFPNERNFALGLVDFDDPTKKRKPVDLDFDRILKFFGYTPNFASGRIGNLTTQLVTYNNFDKDAEYIDEKDAERVNMLKKRDFSEHRTINMFKADISERDTAVISPGKSDMSKLSESSKRVKA